MFCKGALVLFLYSPAHSIHSSLVFFTYFPSFNLYSLSFITCFLNHPYINTCGELIQNLKLFCSHTETFIQDFEGIFLPHQNFNLELCRRTSIAALGSFQFCPTAASDTLSAIQSLHFRYRGLYNDWGLWYQSWDGLYHCSNEYV